MARKAYTPEQIIRKLREAEVFIGEGMTAKEAARKIGVTEQTYYRWRKEYGGMQISQAKRLKALEKENVRLKRLVAEKELDIQILRETIAFESKNF
jgi:putative transposase